MTKNPLGFLPSAATPLEMELVAGGGKGIGDIFMTLVAVTGLLAVAGTTVALENSGKGGAGEAATEDKKAEASDNATEAAGGRIGATVVPPTAWAIAAEASDRATEACSIADT